jgi:CspA family cold shock protein
MSSETTSSQERILGKVKWFNNKTGYGFITVNDNQYTDKDIFVHYSDINVSDSQYKYLVQGEYVEFLLEKMDSDKHEFKATGVTGINGGTIMCETRNKNLRSPVEEGEPRRPRRQPREESSTAASGSDAAPKNDEEEGFTTIVKKRVTKRKPPAKK